MKANRLNLCTVVRNSLLNAGYSTVSVVDAVNAELGKLKLIEETGKTGDSRLTKESVKVTVSASFKYEGKKTTPLVFDTWHSVIAKAEKIATFETVDIPDLFIPWLDKFAKGKAEVLSAEKAALQSEKQVKTAHIETQVKALVGNATSVSATEEKKA